MNRAVTAALGPSVELPAPVPPRRRLGFFELIRRVRENPITVWREELYTRPFTIDRVLLQHFVTLNEPAYIRHVLLTNQENYPKGRLNRQILGPALGDGLLTSEGAFWRRQRRIAAPAFHHRRLVSLAGTMVACANDVANRWESAADSGAVYDMAREMMGLTMDVVARSLFSSDVGRTAGELGRAITVLIDGLGRISPIELLGLPEWLPRRRDPEVKRALRFLDAFIYGILQQRRAGPEGAHGDLLDMLLAARDEETGEGMSDRQLRDEILTLFAAGHETTAVALSWAWFLLDRHPEVQARLHEEIDGVLGGRLPTYDDLSRLPYTRMVLDEAMRLYPPAFTVNRVALKDDEIDGHCVPAGAIVTLSPWLTHRNPRLWTEPGRFNPERFLPEQVRARDRFAYFPFGGGPRICIGQAFALMEGVLLLATLAGRFRPVLDVNHPVEPQGRITLRPRFGVRMTLVRR